MLRSIHSFLPEKAKPYLNWETVRPVQFRLAKNRTTKWGYFKPGLGGKPHTVSLNADLNPQAFLFTLVHEMAHVVCWEKFGRNAHPHGAEWKEIFRHELMTLFTQDVFPTDLVRPIWQTIVKPRASCNANADLIKAFAKYDPPSKMVFIDSLELNQPFETSNKRQFVKGERLRIRFKCQEIATKRWYVFAPTAKVKPI